MSPTILTVFFHLQDSDEYCGAACAQMVLDSSPINRGILPQNQLYTESQNNSVEPAIWFSPPDGLKYVMNHNDSRGFGFFSLVDTPTDNDVRTTQIINTINLYKVAPIVLINNGLHWVVVYGYEVDPEAEPRQIKLYVNNPYYDSGKIVMHTSGGDACPNNPLARITDSEVPYDIWIRDYLTKASFGSVDNWNGKYVAICDPAPVEKKILKPFAFKKYTEGNQLINPYQAKEFAMKAIKKHNLFTNKMSVKYLKKLIPGEPKLVKRIDRKNDYYYIVPIQDVAKNIRAMINIDARFGTLREAGTGQNIQHPLQFKALSHVKIKKAIGDKINLKKGVTKIYKEAISNYPMLVWRPCLQSFSPFWPFHLVSLGNQKIFISLDGKVFTKPYIKKGGM